MKKGGLKCHKKKSSHETTPLLTIVTVVFNAELLLEKTILSITNQFYQNFEYIIIDGASSDNTVDIIKKYEDKIDYWVSEKDSGIYDAMNKAIDIAKGQWINFMNAGDTFAHNNTLNEIFSTQSYDTYDVIYGNRILVKENGDEVLQKTSSDMSIMYYKDLVYHQAAFVNLSEEKYKFNLTYKISADYEYFLRLMKSNKKFLYIDSEICKFLENGLSSHSKQNIFHQQIDVIHALVTHNVSLTHIKKNNFFKHICKNTCVQTIPHKPKASESMLTFLEKIRSKLWR